MTSAQKDEEVFKAASEIRSSAAFGEIIILVVYIPIFFLEGVEGKMFIPMAQTVSFAILGALILSLTYVPMMSSLFLRNTQGRNENISNRIVGSIYRIYAPIRDFALRFQRLVILATVILFALSLWIFSRMGSEFIPTLEEGDFALHQILPPGSSLRKGVEVSSQLQEILTTKFPEVLKVVTKIGTAEIPTDIMPLEAGDIYVIMKPKDEWVSAETREEMFMKMEQELEKYPGVMYEFTQPIQMRFNELMTGVRQDIAIKIYGEDLGLLVEIAHNAEAILEGIQGVGDIQVEPTSGLQQMVVKYDRVRLATYGISISEVNNIIKTSFAGKQAGRFYEGERRFNVVVRLENNERTGIESLHNLHIDLPGGGYVPLSELASISFEEGPTQISRDNTHRRITIGVNARNRDIASLIAEIKRSFDQSLPMPAGYYVRFGGQFENLERAQQRLALVVPLALSLIFLLLYITFNSARYALLIFTTIPLSAIGGIWALFLRDMPFSISAGVGFIALFGVAVLNGIVLVAYLNRLQSTEDTSLLEIIRKGTKVRMRPVIMTASVASLGFLPMALSRSAGAEVQQPLATVVIGGLITATFLTLIILPILYYLLERRRFRKGPLTGIVILLMTGGSLQGQTEISLPEALNRFEQQEEHFSRAAELKMNALDTRSEEPVAPGQWNFSLSGEEFNFSGLSGVQSLNIQKNFRPGNLKESYADMYSVQKGGVENNLQLNLLLLKKELAGIYLQASYLQSLYEIESERRETYSEFVTIARAKAELGEASSIPFRQSQLEIEDIEIRLDQINARRNVQLHQLNVWLKDSTLLVPHLNEVSFGVDSLDVEGHPLLKSLLIQQQMLDASAEILKAQNRVSPYVLGRLQSVNGDFLFFGYQVGVNVPIAGSYRDKQSEALQAESLALEQQWQWERDQISLKSAVLLEERAILESRLERIGVHLMEHEALTEDIKVAYQLGEMTYNEMVVSYQSYYNLRIEQLQVLKESLSNLNEFIHYSN